MSRIMARFQLLNHMFAGKKQAFSPSKLCCLFCRERSFLAGLFFRGSFHLGFH